MPIAVRATAHLSGVDKKSQQPREARALTIADELGNLRDRELKIFVIEDCGID
jgi:hypothetical protein